ncbi:MAG: hypothetical protein ACUVXA_07165 [Candidatus Jordarchaeum sp.]|uniref:hypothetical protein n=1 Tax=Candidatus Jordarchaeum sp. TaxID=2823881 RepID=UPI00404A8BCA
MQKKAGLPIAIILISLVSLIIIKMEQSQNLVLFVSLTLVIASLLGAGIVADGFRRRYLIPVRVLASLENIIVDHIPSGITLWAFDFFKMEHHTIIVSGFIAAVKSFMIEMRKGNLKKLETEFGTFIKEDGDIITITCITSGTTASEENWIRERLQSFLAIAELRHRNDLQNWMGNASIFQESFFRIISSLIDIDKAMKLQKQRKFKIEKKKERLHAELKNLDSKIDIIETQLVNGKISEEEFEVKRNRIKQEYKRIREYYIHTCFLLSRLNRKSREVNIETAKSIERIKDAFFELKIEIENLQVKKFWGDITPNDIRCKNKLQERLTALIENLDELTG